MYKQKRDISKEEIAKQFELPERKSKIATLLKQDGQAYCICRSSDSSRFMIGCDSCEEWYHGDCIGISQKEARFIRQYFCPRCHEEDPTLVTKWKAKRRDDSSRHESSSSHHQHPQPQHTVSHTEEKRSKKRKDRYETDQPKVKNSSKRCGQCMGCYRTDNCGRCDACKAMKKKDANRHRLRCKHRICVNSHQYVPSTRRKKRDSSSDEYEENAHLKNDTPRQCYGPECIKLAQYGSKYCSDDCGVKLATNRIFHVLPQRIQEWAVSPCLSEEKNFKALDHVRKQQMEIREVLRELDQRHKELDSVIERAKNATIDPNDEIEADDENEMSMYCITCGHEIHSRTAIKHMEKCFNKYESQASFGSIFKTRIEGNVMFCDFYNPANRTYCKRLRVLCPEHCKDPKIGDNEVCGCPLVTNVFDLTGDFCRAPKKSCVKHYVWEKLRRAEIDMERVRQWLKFDELIEQERQLKNSLSNRAGVLGLMLHSTYNHEVMEKLTKANQQDQQAMQEELTKKFRKSSHKNRSS